MGLTSLRRHYPITVTADPSEDQPGDGGGQAEGSHETPHPEEVQEDATPGTPAEQEDPAAQLDGTEEDPAGDDPDAVTGMEDTERPAGNASRAEWVRYALATGVDPDLVDDSSRDELRDLVPQDG